MSLRRERVDPVQDENAETLVHRRWLLPDDLGRPILLPQLARLWRGLLELSVLDAQAEVALERLPLPPPADFELVRQDLPAAASAGALLAGSGAATLLTQVVSLRDEDRHDPYAIDGESDVRGFRDYTLYALGTDLHLFLPLPPQRMACGHCGREAEPELPRFGEGVLLDLERACPGCGAKADPGRDKVTLRNGAIFLLEEAACRAALSIELPRAPLAEELPDAQVAALLREVLGGTDELADDGVLAAE